jgi:hypothetical protein
MYVAGNDSEGRSILVTRKKSDGFDGRFDHYVVSGVVLESWASSCCSAQDSAAVMPPRCLW